MILTGSEAETAFSHVYAGYLGGEYGFKSQGYQLKSFDTSTDYAQFNKSYGSASAYELNIAELFTQENGPIVERYRTYLRIEGSTWLTAARLYFIQSNSNFRWSLSELRHNCTTSGTSDSNTAPAVNGTFGIQEGGNSLIPLARFAYNNIKGELLPVHFDLTTLDAYHARNEYYKEPYQHQAGIVPKRFTVTFNEEQNGYQVSGVAQEPQHHPELLGNIKLGQRFTHPLFPGSLIISALDNGGLQILRVNRTETVLQVPTLDLADMIRLLRGSWRNSVMFPTKYPVNYAMKLQDLSTPPEET